MEKEKALTPQRVQDGETLTAARPITLHYVDPGDVYGTYTAICGDPKLVNFKLEGASDDIGVVLCPPTVVLRETDCDVCQRALIEKGIEPLVIDLTEAMDLHE